MTIQYDNLRDAHRANLITWESIVALHQRDYPLCACGTPTAMIVDGIGPICADCEVAQHEAIMQHIRAKLDERGVQ